MTVEEISGDARLSVAERLRYLAVNVARNLRWPNRTFRRQSFCGPRLDRTPVAASPGRALTEAFIHDQLPALMTPGPIRVLEIGCGSGSLTALLAEAGYSGHYVGVDINNRFRDAAETAFTRAFVQADVRSYQPDGQFDLVISISALEHIPDDERVIASLGRLVAPGGVQLHFVPSGWALPVYLWHGYRQYTSASLTRRFEPPGTTLFALGGAATFFLHVCCITVAEFIFRVRVRRKFTTFYGNLLDVCLRIDRLVPVCATMYAVYRPGGDTR